LLKGGDRVSQFIELVLVVLEVIWEQATG